MIGREALGPPPQAASSASATTRQRLMRQVLARGFAIDGRPDDATSVLECLHHLRVVLQHDGAHGSREDLEERNGAMHRADLAVAGTLVLDARDLLQVEIPVQPGAHTE